MNEYFVILYRLLSEKDAFREEDFFPAVTK